MGCEKMLQIKVVIIEKLYKFYIEHFLIKSTVFVLIVINFIKNQKFNFLAKLYEV